jgi:hypothetical protein
MSGWIRLHRGWRDCEFFSAYHQPLLSEREAWIWLIENAAWKETERSAFSGQRIGLERGQIHTSLRALQTAWGWDKSRVERYLNRLQKWDMIRTLSGKDGRTLTICNYETYQGSRDTDEKPTGHNPRNEQDTQEEDKNKKGKKEEKKDGKTSASRSGKAYRFEGKTIKLLEKDYDQWAGAYTAITDLNAELTSLDAWWQSQPDEKKKSWFHATSGMLNRTHQQLTRNPKNPMAGMSFKQAREKLDDLRYKKEMLLDRCRREKDNQGLWDSLKEMKAEIEALDQAVNGKSERSY